MLRKSVPNSPLFEIVDTWSGLILPKEPDTNKMKIWLISFWKLTETLAFNQTIKINLNDESIPPETSYDKVAH